MYVDIIIVIISCFIQTARVEIVSFDLFYFIVLFYFRNHYPAIYINLNKKNPLRTLQFLLFKLATLLLLFLIMGKQKKQQLSDDWIMICDDLCFIAIFQKNLTIKKNRHEYEVVVVHG